MLATFFHQGAFSPAKRPLHHAQSAGGWDTDRRWYEDDLVALEAMLSGQLSQPTNASHYREIKRVRQWVRAVYQDARISQAHFYSRPGWYSVEAWLGEQADRWQKDATLAGTRLHVSMPSDASSSIWVDLELASAIADHFVSNAILNSQMGDMIEVDVRTSRDDEPWLSIEVRDRSSEEVGSLRDHIRWSKSSLRRPYLPPVHGHGLGLRVAVRMADTLHGYIDFSNLPDRGTAFSLHLPAGGVYAWLSRIRRRHLSALKSDTEIFTEDAYRIVVTSASDRIHAGLQDSIAKALWGWAEWIEVSCGRYLVLPSVFLDGPGHRSASREESVAICKAKLIDALERELATPAEVQHLGSMVSILEAVEHAISNLQDGPSYRIDQHAGTHSSVEPPPGVALAPLAFDALVQDSHRGEQTSGRIELQPMTKASEISSPPVQKTMQRPTPNSETRNLRSDPSHTRLPKPKLRFRDLYSIEQEMVGRAGGSMLRDD